MAGHARGSRLRHPKSSNGDHHVRQVNPPWTGTPQALHNRAGYVTSEVVLMAGSLPGDAGPCCRPARQG